MRVLLLRSGECFFFKTGITRADGHAGHTCYSLATTASASGDPHLMNIHGQRFDLMKPGEVVLIEVPRGKPVDDALLIVEATARRLGTECSDMFFQKINVTGSWANDVRAGGITFTAGDETPQILGWTRIGPLELKVARGRTSKGIPYLNFYVKHLGHAGHVVGGLLGEDDHTDAATPGPECIHSIALKSKRPGDVGASVSSVAEASFA